MNIDKMQNLGINQFDFNGNELCVGDIFSEYIKGDVIWDGAAYIIQPALGVIMLNDNIMCNGEHFDINDNIYVKQIREGKARVFDGNNDLTVKKLADENGFITVNLSYNGDTYTDWGRTKKICNVYDL